MIRNPGAPPFLLTADVDGGTFRLRPAVRGDLPAIVRLLADDSMRAGRERQGGMEPYERAFEAIDAVPCHLLVVGELAPQGAVGGPVVATFQISFLAGISRQGAWRSHGPVAPRDPERVNPPAQEKVKEGLRFSGIK